MQAEREIIGGDLKMKVKFPGPKETARAEHEIGDELNQAPVEDEHRVMDKKVTCEEREDGEKKKGPGHGGETLYAEFCSTSVTHHIPLFPRRYPEAVTI
jgi:hypothetical protein